MEDRDFFDHLYALWSKTTGAKDMYWMPYEDTNYFMGGPGTYNIVAVGEDEASKELASYFENEADVDFITAIHGCLPDLVRRLHAALDEADRKDEANDMAQEQLAEALLENQALREEIREWERRYE